jgi:hypothetical protein
MSVHVQLDVELAKLERVAEATVAHGGPDDGRRPSRPGGLDD